MALRDWIDSIRAPRPRASADPAGVTRGRALFEDPAIGCSGCHAGPLFTNNATMNVGTGEPFQVPSLIGVSARAPLMHDGCAATLRDRFGPCGGGDRHGHTSGLSTLQVNDLVSYLETL